MKKKFCWTWIIITIIILLVYFGLTKLSNRTLILSENEVIEKVKSLSEVEDYLKKVPSAQILRNGETINSYLIQVFEVKNGHTATFNWYEVDKTTGEVKKEF